jgi:ribose/xylose/arabinose/galactoside ABC-type transport system permease subunit
LKGGRGSAIGTFVGLLFVALISDAIVLFSVKVQWTNVFIGAVLIFIVIIDANTSKIIQKISESEQKKFKGKSI